MSECCKSTNRIKFLIYFLFGASSNLVIAASPFLKNRDAVPKTPFLGFPFTICQFLCVFLQRFGWSHITEKIVFSSTAAFRIVVQDYVKFLNFSFFYPIRVTLVCFVAVSYVFCLAIDQASDPVGHGLASCVCRKGQ